MVEAGELGVQGVPQSHIESEKSLDYTGLCLKQANKTQQREEETGLLHTKSSTECT